MITVVSDLDGTLMSRGRLELDTVEILRRFQQNNRLILATGRNLEKVGEIVETLQMRQFGSGGLILVNGLETVDFYDGEYRISESISEQECRQILKYVRPVTAHFRVVRSNGSIQKVEMILPVFCRLLTAFLKKRLPEFEVLQIGRNWVEVLPKGTDKENGLRYFMEKYKISPEELYVFGDGENDVRMLRSTENAFAPGNAIPAAKKAARKICAPCAKQGAAKIIKQIMEKGDNL